MFKLSLNFLALLLTSNFSCIAASSTTRISLRTAISHYEPIELFVRDANRDLRDILEGSESLDSQVNSFFENFCCDFRILLKNRYRDLSDIVITEQTKHYWLRTLNYTPVNLDLDGEYISSSLPEKETFSILEKILFSDKNSNRILKIEILSFHGLLMPPTTPSRNMSDSFKILFNFIKNNVEEDPNFVQEILQYLSNFQREQIHHIWTTKECVSCYRNVVDRIKDESISLFRVFLNSASYMKTMTLIDLFFQHKISIFYTHFEPGTGFKIPFYSSFLEDLQHEYLKVYYQVNMESYDESKGDWQKDYILEDFIEFFLGNKPFSEKSLKKIDKLQLQNPNTLSPAQWVALKRFVELGLIRNHLLKKIGISFLLPLEKSGKSKDIFREFVHYINNEDGLYPLISSFSGFKLLFLRDTPDKFIMKKMAETRAKDSFILACHVFPDPRLGLDSKGNNFFHHLLLGEKNQHDNDTLIEKKAMKLIRFILYSGKFKTKNIVKSLTSKNKLGLTPLSLAANLGWYQCFRIMKKYLLEMGYFNQGDHSEANELNWLLLKGAIKRCKNGETDLKNHENILTNIFKNYIQTPEYDPIHSKYRNTVEMIKLKVSLLLDPVSEINSIEIYRKSFGIILEDLKSQIPRFSHAPSQVQMSYIIPLFSLVVKKAIENCPKPILNVQNIFSLICSDYIFCLDRYIEFHLRDFIGKEILRS